MMNKSPIWLAAILFSAGFPVQAEDLGIFCWERLRTNGGICTIELEFKNAGNNLSAQGSQVCTGLNPGDSHVFGNVYVKDGQFEAGLTSVGMAADKSLVWHSGGVFQADMDTLDGILYWMGDTEEKCGDAPVPCVVEEHYTYVDCSADL